MALYPNNEADVSRDQVLGQHITRVANFVTPNHRDLKISRRYQYECPWPAAQVSSELFNDHIHRQTPSSKAELRRLAAFKMPEDKVKCITRVSKIIMNLLSLAQDKSAPGADDFMPVLVFVSWGFYILTRITASCANVHVPLNSSNIYHPNDVFRL